VPAVAAVMAVAMAADTAAAIAAALAAADTAAMPHMAPVTPVAATLVVVTTPAKCLITVKVTRTGALRYPCRARVRPLGRTAATTTSRTAALPRPAIATGRPHKTAGRTHPLRKAVVRHRPPSLSPSPPTPC